VALRLNWQGHTIAAGKTPGAFQYFGIGFLGGRAEAHPYKRQRAYSV